MSFWMILLEVGSGSLAVFSLIGWMDGVGPFSNYRHKVPVVCLYLFVFILSLSAFVWIVTR